jgi:hypothetical protein
MTGNTSRSSRSCAGWAMSRVKTSQSSGVDNDHIWIAADDLASEMGEGLGGPSHSSSRGRYPWR